MKKPMSRIALLMLSVMLSLGTVRIVLGMADEHDSQAMAGDLPVVRVSSAMAAAGAPIRIDGSNFAVGAGNIRISFNDQVIGEAAPPDFSREVIVPAGAAPGLATIHVCIESACGTGSEQDVSVPVRVLPTLADVPVDLMRRALDFFATVQPFVPEWAGATLNDIAYPYFRPDLAGPAYYEFGVQGPAGEQAGFIVVATGEHDYPIAHWSTGGETLATGLLRAADGQALNFYKLSPLTYGAETPDLQHLIRSEGEENPMLKIEGLEDLDLSALNTQFEWTLETGFTQTGLITAPIGLSVREWSDWPELKEGYADNYAPILSVRQAHAAEEWAVSRRREDVGVPLLPGDSYRLLLARPAQYVISGTVGSMVEVEPEPGALQVKVVDAAAEGTPFDIVLTYDDGQTETVRFLAIDTVRYTIQLPAIMANAPAPNGRLQSDLSKSSTRLSEQLLGWSFAYADGEFNGQRLYNQIKPTTWPNVTSCHSGCGATAWAMLFGFGDNQADVWPINSRWMNKWGLYRKDGGVNTGDVGAPLTNDLGVNTMQMEIRREIGTFCLGGSGATWPWSMGGAYRYPERRSWAWVHVYGGYNFINNEYLHVANSIILQRTPGIILTGSLDTLHYPLAYGYAQARVRDCGWDLFKGYTCREKRSVTRSFGSIRDGDRTPPR